MRTYEAERIVHVLRDHVKATKSNKGAQADSIIVSSLFDGVVFNVLLTTP